MAATSNFMRKLCLIVSILYGQTCICQVDSIYARVEITSVSLEEHRTWIDTSIFVTLEKIGHSSIISLGTIDGIEIGFQLEVFKSRLGDANLFISGKAFYFRKDGKWEMHAQPTYRSPEFKIVSAKPSKMPDDYGMSRTTMQGLHIDAKEHYFIIK